MGKKNTTITLIVDTSTITEATKKTAVTFTDNRGDVETPGDPENFTSIVNKNYMVFWTGVGKNNIGTVKITNVDPYNNDSNKKIIKNIKEDPNNENNWQAKVKNNSETKPGDEESYSITIEVDNDSNKVFTLDPKLKIPIGG